MVISWSPDAKLAAEEKLCFDGVPFPLQKTIKILRVEVDRELRFDGHIKHIVQKASHWVTAQWRVAGLLEKCLDTALLRAGIGNLQPVGQIRPAGSELMARQPWYLHKNPARSSLAN